MLKEVYAVVEMLHSVTWFRTVATALPQKNKCENLGLKVDQNVKIGNAKGLT